MRQITVSNITIDVIKKNIKNLHLAVYPPTGRVRIAIPLNTDDESVRLFAISKLAWIKKHQKNFAKQRRETKREYVSGESHYFEGRRYLLNVIYYKGKPKIEIRNKTHIDLYVREGSTLEQREKLMIEWYRQTLKEKIPHLIEKWQKRIGVELKDWQVKRMRTKWGTCNIESKRIWLNLDLAKKPIHCLEYIIVHELVHFIERHHNHNYVSLMDKFLPNWKFYQSELNQLILSYEEWND
jgi:predicted metal-dependent hydrolase